METSSSRSMGSGCTRSPKRLWFFAAWRIFLMLCLLLGLVTISSRAATALPSAPDDKPVKVYLPIINNLVTGQISPANGAVLDTLIPELKFWTVDPGGEVYGCVGLGTAPNPPCHLMYSTMGAYSYRPWANLNPGTLYYWRIGTIINQDYQNPIWSKEWTFTTGQAGGIIPAAPTLIAPADNVSIPQSSLILSWNPVPGAVEYTLWVYNPNTHTTYLYFTTNTSEDFRYNIGTYQKGISYQWYVNARNDYARGPYSSMRTFTLTSVNSSRLPGSILRSQPSWWGYDALGFNIVQPAP